MDEKVIDYSRIKANRELEKEGWGHVISRDTKEIVAQLSGAS